MREQKDDCRPARHERFVAAEPELVSRQPRITGDDSGGDERPQVDVFCQYRKAADQEPDYSARHQIDRLDRAPVEDARARPGDGEGGEEQCIGEIDADQIGHCPIH
jgi:hypothetical protein